MGKSGYPYGKYKREFLTHGVQYSGPEVVLVYGWGWYYQIFYTNPNTGLPWTVAELDSLIAGVTLGQGGGFGSPACDFLELRALWANAEARTDPPMTLAIDQVRLRGMVIEDEAEGSRVYFEYGPNDSYENTIAPEVKAKGESFEADIIITPPVHFRAVIETACSEIFYGLDRLWTGRGATGRSVAYKLVAQQVI